MFDIEKHLRESAVRRITNPNMARDIAIVETDAFGYEEDARKTFERKYEKLLRQSENSHLFYGMSEYLGELSGFIHFSRQNLKLWTVEKIAVVKNSQNQRFGSLLLNEALRQLREDATPRPEEVNLGCRTGGTTDKLIQFYQNCGFEVVCNPKTHQPVVKGATYQLKKKI